MLVGGLGTCEGPPATCTWQGQPRSLRRGGSWRHRTPPRREGVRAPEAGWSGQARDGPAIIRGGPGPPWGVRVRGGSRELPCLPWHAEVLDLRELGEGPETMIPAVRPGPHATSPRRRGGDHIWWYAKGLYTLAGGTPVCMYRQRPPGPPRVKDEPAGGASFPALRRVDCSIRRGRAWMTFPPKRDPRGARPPPVPCASGGSDSCLIRARPSARAVQIPSFPLPSRGHTSDQRARAHRSLGVRERGPGAGNRSTSSRSPRSARREQLFA
jgi:hypothetical protein